jgi:hypothetical protein
MSQTVWVESWEQACCGSVFSEGNELNWVLVAPSASLAQIFDPNDGIVVDAVEAHHGPNLDGSQATTGTVESIRLVHISYFSGVGSDEGVVSPVPGSALLLEAHEIHGQAHSRARVRWVPRRTSDVTGKRPTSLPISAGCLHPITASSARTGRGTVTTQITLRRPPAGSNRSAIRKSSRSGIPLPHGRHERGQRGLPRMPGAPSRWRIRSWVGRCPPTWVTNVSYPTAVTFCSGTVE